MAVENDNGTLNLLASEISKILNNGEYQYDQMIIGLHQSIWRG